MKRIFSISLSFVLFLFCVQSAFAQPTITSFSPLSAKPGDPVAISGTNFNTTLINNIVFFGATKATVTAASATSITATVPIGATFSRITILNTTSNLSGSSSGNFNPIFSPAKTSITSSDFLTKVDFTSGTDPYSVIIGDLDGDGKSDIISVNRNSNTMSIFRNTSVSGSISTSSLATKVDFNTGGGPYQVAIGDLDLDGKLDLAVANSISNTISVFRNTSSTGSININSFASSVDFSTGVGAGSVSISIGDLDGDGKPDLAVANYSINTVSVLRNTGVVGNINSGTFSAPISYATGIRPSSVAIGDIDGDGKAELITGSQTSNFLSIFRNISVPGVCSFSTKVDLTTNGSPYSVVIGDLDGDSKFDLASANYNTNTVSVFRNISTNGNISTSSFDTRVDLTTGTNPATVAIGDLNGDGKPELVSTNQSSNNVSVFRNTSVSGSILSNSFSNKVDFTTFNSPVYVAIGDLDGDHKPDLTVASFNSTIISILRNADITPLPVNILGLQAFQNKNVIEVKWVTNSSINVDYYEIQKSTNGSSFSSVSTITDRGNGSYNWLDASPLNGNSYYRLKVVDKDNSFKYSEIRSVNFSRPSEQTIYPNPIKGNILNISMGIAFTNPLSYSITTIEGKKLQQGKITNRIQSLNIPNLLSGTYLLKIEGITTLILVKE